MILKYYLLKKKMIWNKKRDVLNQNKEHMKKHVNFWKHIELKKIKENLKANNFGWNTQNHIDIS